MSMKIMKKILLFTAILGFSYAANAMHLFDGKDKGGVEKVEHKDTKIDAVEHKIAKKLEVNNPAEDLKKHSISFELMDVKKDAQGDLQFKLDINVADGWKLYAHDNIGPSYHTGKPLMITIQTLPEHSFQYEIKNISSKEIIVITETETKEKTASHEIENKARIYENKTSIPVVLDSKKLHDEEKVLVMIDYSMCDNDGHCNLGHKEILINMAEIK